MIRVIGEGCFVFKCLKIVHVIVMVIFALSWYDMKSLKYSHEYGYDLNWKLIKCALDETGVS